MNLGVGPRAAAYMEITAPSCLPPLMGRRAALGWGTSSAFCGVSVPSRNNGAAISQSVRTHHKDPVISWLGGFQEKGDTKPSSGHLSKGKTPLGKSSLFGVQDIPADCNESPLVQRPPTICL